MRSEDVKFDDINLGGSDLFTTFLRDAKSTRFDSCFVGVFCVTCRVGIH